LAFVAAARAAFVVVKDKDDANRRLFLPMKNNIGNDQAGLAFTLESSIVDCNIETSRISWCSDPVSITANEAMSPNDEPDEKSALEEAEEFLCDLLVSGAVPAKKVRRSSDDAGHSWATIRRAKNKLGIEVKKSGNEWLWELSLKLLPLEVVTQGVQDAQGVHTKSLSTMSNLMVSVNQSNDCEVF
jgi:putative DNA primase/helicase